VYTLLYHNHPWLYPIYEGPCHHIGCQQHVYAGMTRRHWRWTTN